MILIKTKVLCMSLTDWCCR